MKTKYILHGGFTAGIKQQDDDFFQEMMKDTPDEIKMLLVYFAASAEKVQLRTEQDTEELNKNKGNKKLDLRIASPETFVEDCAWADVIYLHGGKTVRLMEALRKYPNIANMLSGKIIAADSAGVNVLGQLFYSKNSKEIGEELNVLPYKTIAHHEDGTHDQFGQINPESETLFLREYETMVIVANS